MSLSISGKAALPEGAREYLRTLLEQPRQRAVVSRILNGESEKLRVICEQVADEDLHIRSDERRSPESLAHGPSYRRSFEVVTAKEAGAGNVRAGVTNTHPFARAVENGTPPHIIRSSGRMTFPWNGLRLGPHDGPGKGVFDVDGPIGWAGHVVTHTGAGAKRIMARSRRRYLDRSRRLLNGR